MKAIYFKNQQSVNAIDLFCGAGGSSYGAQMGGARIVAGFDMWSPAVKAFRANFPQAITYQQDITKLSQQDIQEIHASIGTIDIILASPECTNHSRAKGGAEKSEESRSTAFAVIRFAKEFLPKWIVIENVTEMKKWSKYGKLIVQLKKLGYHVKDDVILNSVDFGVPQSRARLFILCSRLAMPDAPSSDRIARKDICTVIKENTYPFTPLRGKGTP